ncbi:unnamed protein product [Lymnaea stagnalis]|uniref:Small integral membrane protein 20 n=1 Tax=Lymnaea stagnalis TaxID=6523 RepID=A0AAV2H4J8_LYMST
MNSVKRNFKSIIVIGTVVGGIVVASYSVIIAPFLNPTPWKEEQIRSRQGIDREKIQPGNMKVWTDPFERKSD